jgi:predicted NBD/HSP70 family sugar kinase
LTGAPPHGDLPNQQIFAQLAASNDPRAHDLLAQVGQELGIAASWLLNLYNPDVLLLAGGFLQAGERLLKPLRDTALEATVGQVSAPVRISSAAPGRDAPLRGAVLLALQKADHSYRLALGRQTP